MREGDQIMDNFPIFTKNKCSHLYNSFVSVYVREILLQSLNEGNNSKIFWGSLSLQTHQLYLEETKLLRKDLVLFGFFPTFNFFTIIDQCRLFFTSGIDPDILMKPLESI